MEDAKTQEDLIKLKHKNRMKEIETEMKAKLAVVEAEMKLEDSKFDHIMSSYRIKRADRNREGTYG
jgi:hypothetical protein